jgi:phospholipase/lecithinase/hemolysin
MLPGAFEMTGVEAQVAQALAGAGARDILVPNMADLGATPFAISEELQESLSEVSQAFNAALAGAMSALQRRLLGRARIAVVDTFAAQRLIVQRPRLFGFTARRPPASTTIPARRPPARDSCSSTRSMRRPPPIGSSARSSPRRASASERPAFAAWDQHRSRGEVVPRPGPGR